MYLAMYKREKKKDLNKRKENIDYNIRSRLDYNLIIRL